ncbi:MAG: hypothetical protein IT528_09575 [Nitrosomonas sp.]|nr:hypothetical protein [Nitrosomonas sp.]
MNDGNNAKQAIRYLLLALVALLLSPVGNAAPRFAFTLEKMNHPVLDVGALEFDLVVGPQGAQLEINIGQVTIQNKTWRNLKLQCLDFQLSRSQIACDAGRLYVAGRNLPVIFRYTANPQQLLLIVDPDQHESWRLTLDWQKPVWQARLQIINGQSRVMADWLPQNKHWPQLQAGVVNGAIDVSGYENNITAWAASLAVNALAFSDAQGLRAGEHVVLQLDARATREKSVWHWQGELSWSNGELFWQPFYFEGAGQRLAVSGMFENDRLIVDQGELQLTGIGKFLFAGEVGGPEWQFHQMRLQAEKLALTTLFPSVVQPLMMDTALAETAAQGYIDIDWRYHGENNQSLVLKLKDVALTDARERFAVSGINALIPWHSSQAQEGYIHLTHGEILRIPLGKMVTGFTTHARGFSVPFLTIPLLDGEIEVEHLEVTRMSSGWRWDFNGKLAPLSMEKLTEALGVTPMFGTLSGTIPKMTYADAVVTMEGILVFEIFDGVAVARNLKLIEPLGRAPHFMLDVGMHYLDLDLLTRAYSFGNMKGRIDVEINNIELVNWQPIQFDARLISSPGRYRKRISQAAIQNLTALGGASAVNTIQRSFLQFFKDFGYSQIGWRCRLRGNHCQMGGIETADYAQYAVDQTEDYMLVQGSGIPAINITGYNRLVDWHELVKRLSNAIENGSPAIH